MRLIYWLMTLALALVLTVFAVSNLERVPIAFWPFSDLLVAPLYLVVVLALLLGFLIGELVAWINGRHWRREAWRRARKIELLERELATTRPLPPRTEAPRLPVAGMPRD